MGSQTWLITGGAGYVGSHIADLFLENGKNILIYDSMIQGLESRVDYLREKHEQDIPLIVADIRDTDRFEEVLARYKPIGVIHTAALKSVSESMVESKEYFDVNHGSTTKILELLTKHEVRNFIFSSSAAVYSAEIQSRSITEDDPKNPISPYGASKLAAEEEVRKFLLNTGNRGTNLRFFNAIGSASISLMDNSKENLLPIVIEKIKAGQPPLIYGTDYPTPDGTCIRDYVDVRDIARAHLAVVESQSELPFAMNVGTGHGHSVREVIALISDAMGSYSRPPREVGRRPGDSAFVCADVTSIARHLNFRSVYSLRDSIESMCFLPTTQRLKFRFRNNTPEFALNLYRVLRNNKRILFHRVNDQKHSKLYSAMILERYPEFLHAGTTGTVLDVGANVGHFSSACLDFGFEVIAVEPHPVALKQLKKRFKRTDKIKIIPMAVGNAPGIINLVLHPDNKHDPIATSIAASVIPDKFTGDYTTVSVPSLSFASFFQEGQIYELVKIDIEGAEFLLVPDLIQYAGQVKRLLLETHDRFMSDSIMSEEYSENLMKLRNFINTNNLSKRWLTDWI